MITLKTQTFNKIEGMTLRQFKIYVALFPPTTQTVFILTDFNKTK